MKMLRKFDTANYRNFAGIALILTLALIAPVYGGYDYRVAYRGDTLAGTYGLHTISPYPLYWFIYPFAILPENVGYVLWNLANALCFIFAIRYWKGDLLAFSFFIGVFWTFYGGQIEGFVCGALVLAMLPNPWLAGLGLTFLTLKPQIGLLPILFVLLHRRDWKLLAVPALVYLASFLTWGWWIPRWLEALRPIQNVGPFLASNVSLYPYGLVLLILLWRYRSSLKIWMLVQSLMMPYSPIYSLAPVFTILNPRIVVHILIWIFYLMTERFLALSYFGFIFPLAFLILEIWRTERLARAKLEPAGIDASMVETTLDEQQ
ncbi:MAG TPA: glycosyltransferase family 87 protein [Anaerolineales bacterium]|nr:glycosyltransferase family 87 protein [Anaerolineales bacterium]